MDTNTIDANNETASSAVEEQLDAKVDSSAAETSVETKAETLDSAVDKAIAPKVEVAQSTEKESGDKKPTEKEASVEAVAKEETDDKKSEGSKEERKTEDELPPFHKHPRWQEQVERSKTLEKEVAEAKPYVDYARSIEKFQQTNNISTESFDDAMQTLALLQRDPKAGIEALRSFLERAEVAVGAKLPADLAKDVEEGVMPESRAKELAKARAEKQLFEHQQKTSQQTIQQQRHEQMTNALSSWEGTKKTTDVDYQQKVGFINDRFVVLCQQTPPNTAQEIVRLAEKAYVDVTKQMQGIMPKPPVKKHLNTAVSSTKQKTDPQNLDEAVDAELAKRGY